MTPERDITIKSEPDESLSLRYSITSYGADFDVEGLVRRISRQDIYVPPFQRRRVWNIKQASRFVESLLLGLPVPGIFLSKDGESRHLVIDGQQRLRSLEDFYSGIFEPTGKKFALTGLKSPFSGLTYKDLAPEDKRRLDDSIIHATIIRQDYPDDGNSSIYFVFERLNTGGTQLQPEAKSNAVQGHDVTRNGNNVDICLLHSAPEQYRSKTQRPKVVHDAETYVALGELKGGIDPAGADEHWKTANAHLGRIRRSFAALPAMPQLFFVGNAIEASMAGEIWNQLENGDLSNAANLTDDRQAVSLVSWLCSL